MKHFYITTPIYYPNARPHVGSAYTTIVCDAIARYKRMCGYDVAFLTGTDEHGEKLQRAANAAGVPVEQFVVEKRECFKALWRTLGMGEFESMDSLNQSSARSIGSFTPPIKRWFVHTSQNPAHVKSVQWMIQQAKKAGYIEKKKYEGRYCVFDERYVSDSAEPVNCDICGRPAELISEENYFFTLSAFEDRLLKLYGEHPEFVLPDFRMNEVKSFVKSGLRDISISRRRLKWGIPWPGDSEQVVYVWYDALTSYLTGIGFRGADQPGPEFEKYWMGKDGPAEVVHMIGKDILRFHAVYWPAFLMAANDALPATETLPLPKTIFAHGWIYYEKDKMSKSKGNVVYPEPIVKAFEEFGAPGNDALRYYLLRDTPFGLDGSFSYEGLVQRYNSDLANDLGNLANRCLSMIRQYLDGKVPPRPVSGQDPSAAGHGRGIENMVRVFRENFDRLSFSDALSVVGASVSLANKNISDTKPWELAKSSAEEDQEALNRALCGAADLLRAASVLLYPVMPTGTERLWRQLGRTSELGVERGDQLRPEDLEPGAEVGKPEPIFPRLKKEEILRRLHELAEEDRGAGVSPANSQAHEEAKLQSEDQRIENKEQKPAAPSPAPAASPGSGSQSSIVNPQPSISQITIDDFAKVDLRAGTILAAEPIPGATKLLKLQVDIGSEVRQVCAGIAEYYKPEILIGRKVVLVANLQPRKLRGVESNGMIVAASVGEDGRPVLATFTEDVPNGSKLR